MYFALEPEVAGGWGESTAVDVTVHPPLVSKLEYKFDGWLGDDLLETSPCFMVTERLRDKMEESELSGFVFDDVVVTKSEFLIDTEEVSGITIVLPKFYWLKVHGQPGKDDFGLAMLANGYILVVSEQALSLLKQFNLQNCPIRQFNPEEFDPQKSLQWEVEKRPLSGDP